MSAKITSLVTLALSSASFLTWGGFEAYKNQEYNSKMKKYEKYWEEFYDKVLKDHTLKNQLCSSVDECGENKSYLPKPYEYKYWSKVYKSLEVNGKDSSSIEDLKNVQSPDQLIDCCYSEVKKAISNGLAHTNPSSGWFTDCAYDPKT